MLALLRQPDFHGGELKAVDGELAAEALGGPAVARLMTIPGGDAIAGISIGAAVGAFTQFSDGQARRLPGLDPRVRQSGNSAPVHGRLVARNRRKLELAAGAPSRRGNHRQPGAACNSKQRRNQETAAAEQAERAYQVLAAHWQPRQRPRTSDRA